MSFLSAGILGSWAEKPLFERKQKPMSPDDLDQMLRASISLRHHAMSEEGKDIHKILRDSADALKTSKGKHEEIAKDEEEEEGEDREDAGKDKYERSIAQLLISHVD